MFPVDLITLERPVGSQNRIGHADLHVLTAELVEALMAKVGVDNSNDTSSIDYILRQAVGAWTSYTPTVQGSGGGSGVGVSSNGRYKLIGKTCHFELNVSMTGIGSLSGPVIVGLPFTSSFSLIGEVPISGFMCLFNENPQTQSRGVPVIVSNSSNVQFLLGVDAAATNWSTGDWRIRARGTYEIA